MDDPTRDTAAAMLRALRSADLSSQSLAVGLADALKVLVDRESEEYIDLIIVHIRNNDYA